MAKVVEMNVAQRVWIVVVVDPSFDAVVAIVRHSRHIAAVVVATLDLAVEDQ